MKLPDPKDTWLLYQFLVVTGTWTFAASTYYIAYKIHKFSKMAENLSMFFPKEKK